MRRTLGQLFLAIVLLADAAWIPDAHARSSSSQNRQRQAGLVTQLFERFFFVEWLGEPLSLGRGFGACPQPQLRAALREPAKFPKTFLRRKPHPEIPAQYCGAAERKGSDKRWLSFTVTVPNATSCEAYVKRWQAVVTASDREEALRPYAVTDQIYNKYAIEPQSRTIRLQTPGQRNALEPFPTSARLVRHGEASGLCRFAFEQDESKYERDVKQLRGWWQCLRRLAGCERRGP
jgi:hypothetical protein